MTSPTITSETMRDLDMMLGDVQERQQMINTKQQDILTRGLETTVI